MKRNLFQIAISLLMVISGCSGNVKLADETCDGHFVAFPQMLPSGYYPVEVALSDPVFHPDSLRNVYHMTQYGLLYRVPIDSTMFEIVADHPRFNNYCNLKLAAFCSENETVIIEIYGIPTPPLHVSCGTMSREESTYRCWSYWASGIDASDSIDTEISCRNNKPD